MKRIIFLTTFVGSIGFFLSCRTVSESSEQADTKPPPFQQTLKGYMAELGQYMDDVYRFWDSKTMHETALERLDEMVEIHDSVLEIYADYLDDHSIIEYQTQHAAFQTYLEKSRQLTLELKKAIQSMDDSLILKAFGDLDQSRRDAHSHFGEAL
ncbi:MAG: hypothetical protein AAF065_02220 [Verrucomicrobiota bacterium]